MVAFEVWTDSMLGLRHKYQHHLYIVQSSFLNTADTLFPSKRLTEEEKVFQALL